MVSVIIPVFNRADTIQQTLNSLLSQTSQEWECILVDDGSTDHSERLIQKYIQSDNRFHFYKRPLDRTKGPSVCRNIGLNTAKGSFVVFLDSDDLLADFCIEERLKAFHANPDLDFLVFDMKIFSDNLPLIEQIDLEERNQETWLNNFMILAGSWQTTAPIYKTNYVKKIGGFAEEIMIFEDFEIAANALFNSDRYKVYSNVDYFYRNDESYFLKHVDLNYEKKVVDAFVKLIALYQQKIISKATEKSQIGTLKENILKSYNTIFERYIVMNVPVFKDDNYKIIKFLYAYNYIGIWKCFEYFIIQNVLFKLHKIKGLGLYRLIKYLMK